MSNVAFRKKVKREGRYLLYNDIIIIIAEIYTGFSDGNDKKEKDK